MTTLTVSPRGFTDAEFERRCSAAQQIMLEQNLDAMLFASEPEMRYFTGFMTPFLAEPDSAMVSGIAAFWQTGCCHSNYWCAIDGKLLCR